MDALRKIVRKTLMEYVTPRDLKDIETFADSKFSDVGIDVEFTRHFLDRVNDPRNGEEITPEELKMLYLKARRKYGEMLSQLKPGQERVFNDTDTNINIPVAIGWDGKSQDLDMTAKTVMRKKNFLTSPTSPKLQLEKDTTEENIDVPINIGDEVLGGRFKNKKVVVKNIGTNEKGDITINDKPLLRVRTLNNEEYIPSKNFYKATIKVSDLYVELDNMLDAYHKSKNGIGPSSRSGDKPLTVAKLLDGTLLLLDGHHRIADKIKYLERPNIKNILNLKFEAIIHNENFDNIESIEQVDRDFQYWAPFTDWVYTTFQK